MAQQLGLVPAIENFFPPLVLPLVTDTIRMLI